MAWEDELVGIVRIMIDDDESPYTYSNDRLQKVIVVSANLVQIDTAYSFEYTVSVPDIDMVPDPTVTETRNQTFLDLITLRASCFIEQSKLRSVADKPNISTKEFQTATSIDYKGVVDARLKMLEIGYCKLYQDALNGYLFSDNDDVYGVSVVSPFRVYYNNRMNYRSDFFLK